MNKTSSQLLTGALYILLGELLIALMIAIIKLMSSQGYSNESLVFYRNLFGLLTLLPILLMQNGPRAFVTHLKTKKLPLHLFRATAGVTAMYCFFYIIAHIPLAEATLVKLSTPFFLPIVAYLWLRETVHRNNRFAIALGFVGVIIILKPGTDQFQAVALIGLFGAALAATAKVAIRRMADTEPSTRIVFYFATLATLVSALPYLVTLNIDSTTPGAHSTISGTAWFWFFLMGLLGTTGQIALTYAYRIANPGKIGAYTYASILYASLIGWLCWGEVLAITTLIGSALIILAGWLNLKRPEQT